MTDPTERSATEALEERARERRAAAERIKHQHNWVDLQVRQAMERGEFDGLPGLGKPLEGLGETHDPDWWVRRLVEREQLSVLPPALQVRRDDAGLDDLLDRHTAESEVRREVEEFNARVRDATWQPLGGPPMVTRERDVETEVARWQERQQARRAAARAALESSRAEANPEAGVRRRRWPFRRTHR